jgi:hypothetical protein
MLSEYCLTNTDLKWKTVGKDNVKRETKKAAIV